MLRKLLLLLTAVLVFQSCTINTSGTWKNDRIDKEKRMQIKALNDKLIEAVAGGDVQTVRSLVSDALLAKSGPTLDTLLEQVSHVLRSKNYAVLDEYNIRNSRTGVDNKVASDNLGDNDYIISYQALNKDMYVSLLLPLDVDSQGLVTVIYGKQGNDWKINILNFGRYKIRHKTAPEYYSMADAYIKADNFVDALICIDIAEQCMNPGGSCFRFKKQAEMTASRDKLLSVAKEKWQFPITLDRVSTKPKLLGVTTGMIDEGVFPLVYYWTAVSIRDTVAVKAENEKMKKEVGMLFKGIDQNRKYVFYRAFNEMPDNKTQKPYFGMIDELKQ